MKIKVIITVLLILLYFITGVIVVDFDKAGFIIGSFSFFLLSFFFINKNSYKQKSLKLLLILYFLIHVIIITTVLIFKGFDEMRLGGNLYILYFAVCIFAGYSFVITSSIKNKIFLLLFFIFLTFISSYVISTFVQQIDFYGSISGNEVYSLNENNFEVLDYKESKKINLSKLDNKIIVLDFWNNNCAVCYKKFPTYKILSDKYKNSKNVEFYLVNSYEDVQEIKEGQLIADSLNYNLNNYFQERKISENLKIFGFPTVLVLKRNKIIFRGSIETLSMLDFIYLKQ
ncbi:TlpA family protein disulfide reductase [Flavobacterium sp.]